MTTRCFSLLMAVMLLAPLSTASAQAQQAAPPDRITPLELEIVISRFQGEKRISSVPYLLAVNAVQSLNGAPETQLNMGTEVPVPSTTVTQGDGKVAPLRSYNYRLVGTNMTATAARTDDGRFEVRLFIDDGSVYTSSDSRQGGPIVAEMPVFRTFRTRNNLMLRDGQTRQYTAATDRISGEVVKVDVTLRVLK